MIFFISVSYISISLLIKSLLISFRIPILSNFLILPCMCNFLYWKLRQDGKRICLSLVLSFSFFTTYFLSSWACSVQTRGISCGRIWRVLDVTLKSVQAWIKEDTVKKKRRQEKTSVKTKTQQAWFAKVVMRLDMRSDRQNQCVLANKPRTDTFWFKVLCCGWFICPSNVADCKIGWLILYHNSAEWSGGVH